MGYAIQQGNTTIPLTFFMQDSTSTRRLGKTGLSPTVTISKNGGAFASPAGAVTEIGNGVYRVAASATDANTLGVIELYATATGADPWNDSFLCVAYNPFAVADLGLSRLDAAISSRSTYAGADTSGTTTLLSLLTATRAGYLDNLNGMTLSTIVSGVWAAATRTLTAISDSSGVTTLLSRLTSTRAGLLDNLDATVSSRSTLTAGNVWDALLTGITTVGSVGKLIKDYLDAAISSRSTYAGADTSGTTTLLSRLTSTRAGLLDNLDATVSSRSTYAGGDTAGTTTLLSRLTPTRAGYLDNLAYITAAPPTSSAIASAVWAASTRTLTSGGGGGGAPVLYASPLSVVVEAGASDEQFLSLRRSHIGPVRMNLVDANKVPIPTTGATLSAKIYSPGGTQLLTGLTVTELLGDEGQVSVQVDMTDAALANYSSVNLAVIRTNGATDVTTATLAIRILG